MIQYIPSLNEINLKIEATKHTVDMDDFKLIKELNKKSK